MEVDGVFEGGGVRGIALAGAAAAAIDRGIQFHTAIGTSAGAMVASLVAAGYDGDELGEAVCATDWPSLLDAVPGYRIPLLGRNLALVRYRGFFYGERLETTWREALARKNVTTFGDLSPGALKIVATDLNHSIGVVLPKGLERYGIDPKKFSIAKAVRMSASIPFMFRPVVLRDTRSGEKVLFADGAMAANFPIGLASSDRPALGFVLDTDATEHPHVEVRGPASLARSVIMAGIHGRYALPRPEDPAKHILEIPVSPDLDFDLTPQAARRVFDRGRVAATRQLEEQLVG
jgi:NTE family protein